MIRHLCGLAPVVVGVALVAWSTPIAALCATALRELRLAHGDDASTRRLVLSFLRASGVLFIVMGGYWVIVGIG